jgi:hypothetical protein
LEILGPRGLLDFRELPEYKARLVLLGIQELLEIQERLEIQEHSEIREL